MIPFRVCKGNIIYETGISTIKQETSTQTRVPRAHGNRRWTQNPGASAAKGTGTTDGIELPDQRLPRSARLRSTREFQEAYAQQRRVVGRYLVVFIRLGPDAALRLGVVASRRVGNAVERARAKRRLREGFRRLRHGLQGNCDVVLVARRSILSARFSSLESDLLRALQKAGLRAGRDGNFVP